MGSRTLILAGVGILASWWSAAAGDPLSSWEIRETPTPRPLRAVTYGNGLFVAVGDHGTIITSTDGASWSAQSAGTTAVDLSAVCWGNGRFVTVGEDLIDYHGHILTSSNGV